MNDKALRVGMIALQSKNTAAELKQRLIDMAIFDAVEMVTSSDLPQQKPAHVTLFCDLATWQHTSLLFHPVERLVLLGADNHDALQAFAQNAFCFLSTPLVEEQVAKVGMRLKQQLCSDEIASKWRAIQQGLSQQLGIPAAAVSARIARFFDAQKGNMLVLKTLTNTVVLAWQDIIKIHAEGDYMKVITRQDELYIRSSLGTLLKTLDNHHFLRISRSVAVNLQHVENVICTDKRNHFVKFKDHSVEKFSTRWFEQYRNQLH
ncbi:LytR/AlgR family response regulator transcription factor [Alteromonas ponticola]|uniref:HTH LytTR-type domain-containing protein n=1 Tax=Alteromonas ponticola TaxID=2720613 RepID=A0ABX1R1M5_9ALTE|nr:LytTR family DNA-binding domain-containing protein [Alteromonas ponticola]NMH59346.1 hypothetical protein [Alteromonas ponticola]